jgi:glycogen synthase
MAPIAKVGGMGDVVTALARAVQDEGNMVEVIIPKYDVISYHQVGVSKQHVLGRGQRCRSPPYACSTAGL